MKKLFSVTLLALLTVASFTAQARGGGHRGGGHHSSGHSYSHSNYAPAPAKKASPKRRTARYIAAGTVGYGAYQAHNYATSYVREKGRQDARRPSAQYYQDREQTQPEAVPVSAAPTCTPLALAAQPGYTRLPVCPNN